MGRNRRHRCFFPGVFSLAQRVRAYRLSNNKKEKRKRQEQGGKSYPETDGFRRRRFDRRRAKRRRFVKRALFGRRGRQGDLERETDERTAFAVYATRGRRNQDYALLAEKKAFNNTPIYSPRLFKSEKELWKLVASGRHDTP